MDINDLRSIVTVVSLLTFLGIVWWAYGVKSNKQRFEETANLPFSDPDEERGELGLAARNEQRKTS